MNIVIEKEQLKKVIKESLAEVFEQKKDYFIELFGEVIEEKLFLEAIKSSEDSDSVSREEIFAALDV